MVVEIERILKEWVNFDCILIMICMFSIDQKVYLLVHQNSELRDKSIHLSFYVESAEVYRCSASGP